MRAASAAFREPPAHFNVCEILPQYSSAFEEELLYLKLFAVKLSARVPPRLTGPVQRGAWRPEATHEHLSAQISVRV